MSGTIGRKTTYEVIIKNDRFLQRSHKHFMKIKQILENHVHLHQFKVSKLLNETNTKKLV